MAHPFFDVPAYPWHRPEACRLHRALYLTFREPPRIDTLYQACAGNLPPLALGAAPDVIWKAALENLAAFDALRRLCELLHDEPQWNIASTRGPALEVLNAQPAVDTRIVSDDVLVLDRENLRDQLKLLESAESLVKVLIVRGAPGSGKSHGQLLFERAARDSGAVAVYLYESMVVTVDDVIAELFAALEASDKIPPRLSSLDAWYREVCRKLMELAATKKRHLWIAVDDLGVGEDGGPLLDTEIRNFCEQFVLHMGSDAFRRWFRLMLIDYPDVKKPTRWPKAVLGEDRTKDTDVDEKHVSELLQSWLVTHDRTMLDEDLKKLTDKVLADANVRAAGDDYVPRLQGIHDSLTETLRNLAKGGQ